MQLIDIAIVVLCISAALGGYKLGFVTRAASWVGVLGGFLISAQFLPTLLRSLRDSAPLMRLGAALVLLLAGILFGQLVGLFLGSRLAANIPTQGRFRRYDQIAGAFIGVLGLMTIVWLVLPAAANVPGWTAQQVRQSDIAQGLYDNTPAPPDFFTALRRLVGDSSYVSVFQNIAPTEDNEAPPSNASIDASVVSRIRESTVKVSGTACHRLQEGSGFAVAPGLVATNAHVVAGESRTTVMSPSGAEYKATVVLFDPERDLALLRASGYSEPPLPVQDASVGQVGAVFGHPGGQDALAVQPGVVRRQITAVGRDLYDNNPTRRSVLVLGSQLKQGDSGGAFVSQQGSVIGVAFAIAPDNQDVAYALAPSELRAVLELPHSNAVSTGPCIND